MHKSLFVVAFMLTGLAAHAQNQHAIIPLVVSVLKVAAQNSMSESPGELILAIEKSKQDTNRINLLLKLGSYYHFKPLSNPAKPGEYRSNQNSATNLFNQALELSIKLNKTDWQYQALEMLAESESESNPAYAKQIFLKAVTHYQQE